MAFLCFSFYDIKTREIWFSCVFFASIFSGMILNMAHPYFMW